MFTKVTRWGARARLLALVLAVWGATACAAPRGAPADLGWRSTVAPAQGQSVEVAAGRASGVVAGPEAPGAPETSPVAEPTTEQIIRDVIERGNLAQAAAISSRDQSVMAATSTERY